MKFSDVFRTPGISFLSTQLVIMNRPNIGVIAPNVYEKGPNFPSSVFLLLKTFTAGGPKQTRDVQRRVIPIVANVWNSSKLLLIIPSIIVIWPAIFIPTYNRIKVFSKLLISYIRGRILKPSPAIIHIIQPNESCNLNAYCISTKLLE